MRTSTLRRVWTLPLLLALLTVFALLAALLGSGVWRVLSWLGLTLPVAVGLRYSLLPAPVSRRSAFR